jgi:2-dehydro-3-deoxygluconokinase
MGEREVRRLVERTKKLGVNEVIIKRGSSSCLVFYGSDDLVEVPALSLDPSSIVDTTAAGDSFSAGYLSRRLAGDSTRKSTEQGHLVASIVIQHKGAVVPISVINGRMS